LPYLAFKIILSGKVTPFFANGKIFYLNNCYPKLFCYLWRHEEMFRHIAVALLDAFAFSPVSASGRYHRYHIAIERY
jgi:hypothetical protein